MERTNYVNKAKDLILKTARTTALVIVPLAAAVTARGGAIAIPGGNPSCTTNIPSGSCASIDTQLADLGSGIEGLSLFLSGGGEQGFQVFSSGSSTLLVTLLDFGTVSGGSIPAGTMIPLGYSFTAAMLSGGSIGSWSVTFELGLSPGGSDYGQAIESGSGSGTFSGGGVLDVSPTIASGSTLYETAQLNLTVNGPGFVEVTIPGDGSFDFDSVPSVPEPGSVGLIGAGLAFLGALLRRSRR